MSISTTDLYSFLTENQFVFTAKREPGVRPDCTPLVPNDVWIDMKTPTIKQWTGTAWQTGPQLNYSSAQGILSDWNTGAVPPAPGFQIIIPITEVSQMQGWGLAAPGIFQCQRAGKFYIDFGFTVWNDSGVAAYSMDGGALLLKNTSVPSPTNIVSSFNYAQQKAAPFYNVAHFSKTAIYDFAVGDNVNILINSSSTYLRLKDIYITISRVS